MTRTLPSRTRTHTHTHTRSMVALLRYYRRKATMLRIGGGAP